MVKLACQRWKRVKQITGNDEAGLLEGVYLISKCLVTLQQLRYKLDYYSTDALRKNNA